VQAAGAGDARLGDLGGDVVTDRPSRWQSLPASIAAMMPPSLISLSDTPPAPAFALVSMSANE
jgi:hypothetical protein